MNRENKRGLSSATKKAACLATALTLAVAPMTGCSAITSLFNPESGTTRGTVNTLSSLTQRTFQLDKGAENVMCNGALKLTYLDMQRRPMSTFSGQKMSSAGLSGGGASGEVSEFQTNDIVVQIDVSFTWNVNTYIDTTTTVLGGAGTVPETLGEILAPGILTYVQGTDDAGESYLSGDVVLVNSDTGTTLSTTSGWNYNILNTPLPETSVRAEGSFLMRVASTATNLELVIVTPTGGQDMGKPEAIFDRSIDIYTLPLT